MKIRIEKASRDTLWYADEIGSEFDVVDEYEDDVVIASDGRATYYVLKDDISYITGE